MLTIERVNRTFLNQLLEQVTSVLFKSSLHRDFTMYQQGPISVKWLIDPELMNCKGQFPCN